MGGHGALETTKTVLEVADMAWAAMESHHHHRSLNQNQDEEEELESLRAENRRLRNSLEQNLKLLHNLSESPCLSSDCPPDLYARIVETVDSNEFLQQIKSLHREVSSSRTCHEFALNDDTADIVIDTEHGHPSQWVWISEEMVPGNVEEWSGIDDESYLVVSEDQVVEGVAYFMARCIISNPKSKKLTPGELQKIMVKALGSVSKLEKMIGVWHAGKLFYTFSKWGLLLTGVLRTPAVLKLVAMGVTTTTKLALKAL